MKHIEEKYTKDIHRIGNEISDIFGDKLHETMAGNQFTTNEANFLMCNALVNTVATITTAWAFGTHDEPDKIIATIYQVLLCLAEWTGIEICNLLESLNKIDASKLEQKHIDYIKNNYQNLIVEYLLENAKQGKEND